MEQLPNPDPSDALPLEEVESIASTLATTDLESEADEVVNLEGTHDDDVPSASEADSDMGDEGEGDQDSSAEQAGIRRGDLIEGTILEANDQHILVDLGNGVSGIVQNRELQYLDPQIATSLTAGHQLMVYVLKTRGTGSQPLLSISRALEENDWREAEEYGENKQVYEGRVAGYNKGGLIVRFGRLRGFIPASQISQEREKRAGGDSPDQRWSEMLNETIFVKVVEVNRQRNRLILSERAAARENRELQKLRLIDQLTVGEMRAGKVISLTDFGAFVDLGGADGLIHLTELSWKHVNHPRELLKVGDEVQVKVISVDRDRKRIGLSMKSLEEDPWQEVMKSYSENQLVQAKITKLTRFGAFASLMDNMDVEGLIHVSELAEYRVEHPRDVVAVGDVLTLRVIKIDVERRRLGLSLKRVNSTKFMSSDWGSWNPS